MKNLLKGFGVDRYGRILSFVGVIIHFSAGPYYISFSREEKETNIIIADKETMSILWKGTMSQMVNRLTKDSL